jgi:hypothetical protein
MVGRQPFIKTSRLLFLEFGLLGFTCALLVMPIRQSHSRIGSDSPALPWQFYAKVAVGDDIMTSRRLPQRSRLTAAGNVIVHPDSAPADNTALRSVTAAIDGVIQFPYTGRTNDYPASAQGFEIAPLRPTEKRII